MITYGTQIWELKVGSIDLQDVASSLSEHINSEPHPLL